MGEAAEHLRIPGGQEAAAGVEPAEADLGIVLQQLVGVERMGGRLRGGEQLRRRRLGERPVERRMGAEQRLARREVGGEPDQRADQAEDRGLRFGAHQSPLRSTRVAAIEASGRARRRGMLAQRAQRRRAARAGPRRGPSRARGSS